MPAESPTTELYRQFDEVVQHLNRTLFSSELPLVVIRLQRHMGSNGHFSPARWAQRDGGTAHQISLNPYYFAKRPLQDVFQTLVHQMCHLWQFQFGTPSRGGYHNLEWAQKMTSLGLIPTTTGDLHGKMVGQTLTEMVDPKGKFRFACLEYFTIGGRWSWLDRDCEAISVQEVGIGHKPQAPSLILDSPAHLLFAGFSVIDEGSEKKIKLKYACPSCGSSVWGKAGLDIACRQCDTDYICRPMGGLPLSDLVAASQL